MRKIALSICFLLCSINVSAITLPTSDLPSELQNCFLSGDCVAAITPRGRWTSDFETTGAAAFSYQQWNGSSYDSRWLMRYDLLDPPGTVQGTAWLTAQNYYNPATGYADFSLYYENSIYGNEPTMLAMSSADLAAGGANFISDGISGEPSTGTLYVYPWPAAVVETYYEFQFNLLHMTYNNGIFSFDPNDSRSLLFSQRLVQWHPESNPEYAQSYMSLYVHAVPLPASALLLLSGLAGGALGMRKKTA